MSSSLRKWAEDLPWMMQGVLFGAVRNCDGHDAKPANPVKVITRGIRCAFIKSAQSSGSFNARRPTLEQIKTATVEFLDSSVNNMPVHFVQHLMMAVQVIAYSHPDSKVREAWLYVYLKIVKHFHLEPESIGKYNHRLGDDLEQVKRENISDALCYASDDYGDNTGTKNEGDK